MELDKVIKNRNSIRKYKNKQIPFNNLVLLLDAAIHAPSSGNLQDFRFIIVTDKHKKNKIAELSLKQFWMNTAPVFIVVCSDIQRLKDHYPKRAEEYSVRNSAAAAILISLKAVDLGLDTCWVHVFDNTALSKLLRIKEGVIPQVIITVGYENEKPIKPIKPISLDRITFFNSYNSREIDVISWGKEKSIDKLKSLLKKLK